MRESLLERRRLLDHAPHLVRSLALTVPIYSGARRGRLLIKLGMIAYDLLSAGKSLAAHRMLDAEELLEAEPGLRADGLKGGARYFDAQVTYAERLVVEIVLDAAANGADVRNHSPVTRIENRRNNGFVVHFAENGEPSSVDAPVVINAAGPWVDSLLGMTDGQFSRYIGGTKGSHIVVDPFPGAPNDAIYVEAVSDSRPIFILPWNEQYLVGTTDLRYTGDPRDSRADDEEIDYLLAEANRVIPGAGLRVQNIRFTYSGVRPLPRHDEGPVSAITRRHIIHEHEGNADGLISIIGGKLTTYRSLAEQATDTVCRRLGRNAGTCPTRTRRLPGGDSVESLPTVLADVSPDVAERLKSVYGSRVVDLAGLCDAEPSLCRALSADAAVLAVEVVFAIRQEFARGLVDLIYRRLMVGLSGDLPDNLVAGITGIAARELGWDADRQALELAHLAEFGDRLRRRH